MPPLRDRVNDVRRQLSFWLNRPEYIYQPAKLLRRVLSKNAKFKGVKIVCLPWRLPLEVDCSDVIGITIAHHGVFELPVVETIFRLVDSSDVFLDVGANLGYMTSVAVAAGSKRTISFEPHPVLFARLSRNVRLWRKARPDIAERVEVLEEAVSSTSGTALLRIPLGTFQLNNGLATLEPMQAANMVESIRVATVTLDEIVAQFGPIGVLKLDIEGHELKAFSASRGSLAAGRIRDIVYEDFGGLASETSKLLCSFGYTIFGVNKGVSGPVLLEDAEAARRFGSPNLIASIEPARVRERMARRGYKCLSA